MHVQKDNGAHLQNDYTPVGLGNSIDLLFIILMSSINT